MMRQMQLRGIQRLNPARVMALLSCYASNIRAMTKRCPVVCFSYLLQTCTSIAFGFPARIACHTCRTNFLSMPFPPHLGLIEMSYAGWKSLEWAVRDPSSHAGARADSVETKAQPTASMQPRASPEKQRTPVCRLMCTQKAALMMDHSQVMPFDKAFTSAAPCAGSPPSATALS